VFENMVLRRIFGPRRDEVTGEWMRLHNEEKCGKKKIFVLKVNNKFLASYIVKVFKHR